MFNDLNKGTGRHVRISSMSTISFADEPHDDVLRPPIRLENTYQLEPARRLSTLAITNIIRDVFESYLAEEKYEAELCKQMTKTVSEVVKARVKEMMVPRYKIICVVHIGQLDGQGCKITSRCLWDQRYDTCSTYEYRNHSLFAVGTVYGVYSE
ncbi:dynein light chain Tctex-type 5-B-like isoform X2 [Lineus longissimus]|uniref:dynein light chain Tctex-type 5-B-like isoform X2 n=1 Tax=Lineus longissimus TaxID=88925 RepID=UPI00315C8101